MPGEIHYIVRMAWDFGLEIAILSNRKTWLNYMLIMKTKLDVFMGKFCNLNQMCLREFFVTSITEINFTHVTYFMKYIVHGWDT